MDKKKREKIFIAALFPILLYVVYSNLIAGKPAPPPPQEESPAVITPPASAKEGKSSSVELELRPVDEATMSAQLQINALNWGRNPFVTAPTPVRETVDIAEASNFRLSSVFPSESGGAAVINGVLIETGEIYQGFELLVVEETRVRLGRNGENFMLSMPEE